jgi:hypothetical protein
MTEFFRKMTKQDIRNTLAVTVIVMFFLTLWKLMAEIIPAENKDVVMVFVGGLGTIVSGIVGYYYGQSKSENEKGKDI